MVLILTKIQQTVSQAGRFASFGFAVHDANFTTGPIMGSENRYINWTLEKPIPAFNYTRRVILVSKWL